MQGEHDPTTRDLIRAALAEFATVGQAEFTMDGVAKRAFYSPGTLYSRWSDRSELLAEIARDIILRDLEAELARTTDPVQAISCVLDGSRALLALIGEILIAGHSMPAVQGVALQAWSTLRIGLERHLPPGLAWYVATIAVGGGLLDSIGLPGPTPPSGRIAWLVDARAIEVEERHVSGHGSMQGDVDFPEVPPPSRSDATAQSLIQAAQTLLAAHGAEGLSTRRVSAEAGVTTGAIYRRYDGKAALLADVLLVELAPDRYAWTWDLVEALATQDPYWNAADAITEQLIKVARDDASQRVLLQIGVAARNDEMLRAKVQERVLVAHAARTEMFTRLRDAGVMRTDVDPAVFAWGFQTLPVGLRALTPLGIPVDETAAATSMRSILTAAAAREESVDANSGS